MQIADIDESVERLENRFEGQPLDKFFLWLYQALETPLPLRAMSRVSIDGKTPAIAKNILLSNSSGNERVTFQWAPYDVLLLLCDEDASFDIRQYGSRDGINFLAYTPDAIVGASVCHQMDISLPPSMTSHSIVKDSETFEFEGGFENVGFGFFLLRYSYMVTAKILGKRLNEAPVANNVLQHDIASWCRLSGISVTDTLARNHEVGIITRGEAQAMWDFAVRTGLLEGQGFPEIFPATTMALIQEASALRVAP